MAQASPGHVGRWTCKLKSAQTSANLRIEPGEKKVSVCPVDLEHQNHVTFQADCASSDSSTLYHLTL